MTREQLALLGGLQPAGPTGAHDVLDRFYTPDSAADLCLDTAWTFAEAPALVIEGSVGGGAFARAARRRWGALWGSRILGVDLDPHAAGFDLCDQRHVGSWPEVAPTLRLEHPARTIVIGNPPFSDDTAIEHVEASLSLAPRVLAQILPLHFLGVGRWELMRDSRRPAYMRPILPRPWPANCREVALFVWTPRDLVRNTMILEPLVWK